MEDRPIFPDPPAVTVERTLAIIKPDAVEYADEIIEEINRAGFTILQVCEHVEHWRQRISRSTSVMLCLLQHRVPVSEFNV